MQCRIEELAANLDFPEGPAFAPDGSLWFVELNAGNLVRWSANHLHRYPSSGSPNGLAFDRVGRAWFCDARQNAIRRFDPATEEWITVVNNLKGGPLNNPNDLAFDARGNLIFTCPGRSLHDPTGYVCCLTPEGQLTKIAEGMYFPNGLAFVDEGRTLVIAETYRQRLRKGAWDAVLTRWLDPKPWVDFGGEPGPDGMAFGAGGQLYVAVYRSAQIKVVDPQGQVIREYDLPGSNPTNAAFDPRKGNLGLVVTEAERGLLLSLPDLGPGVPLFDGGEVWSL
jgi:gluconolactonase